MTRTFEDAAKVDTHRKRVAAELLTAVAEQSAEYATELYTNMRSGDNTDFEDGDLWDADSLQEVATWAARKALGLESYDGAGDAR